VQERNEAWECSDPACGQHIQFLMLDRVPDRADPTCFCGSNMRRSYVKPHFTKYENISPIDPGAPAAAKVSVKVFVLSLDAMTCLLPGSDA
jgi:hypothetical protein